MGPTEKERTNKKKVILVLAAERTVRRVRKIPKCNPRAIAWMGRSVVYTWRAVVSGETSNVLGNVWGGACEKGLCKDTYFCFDSN